MTPNNLIEIRDLVHACWDLNAPKLSNQFISKLILDDDYQNISLISQNHEFFLDMKKAERFHTLLGLKDFALTRDLFYSRKYTDIMPLCEMPEEGDFQFLWGIMAARVNEGTNVAKGFSQHYLFEDDWAETIGMTLAGKLTPEELINEATSPISFGGRRGRLTEAYFYAAICHMEKGKEDFKKVHFYLDKCIKLNFRDYYEYISATVLKKILPEPPKWHVHFVSIQGRFTMKTKNVLIYNAPIANSSMSPKSSSFLKKRKKQNMTSMKMTLLTQVIEIF